MAQFSLTTNDSRCKWRTSASDTWINNISPDAGTGSKDITFTISSNPNSARSGVINIYNTNNDPNGTNIVANVLIEQDGAPVPVSCSGHPPLLDTYTLSGGPVTTADIISVPVGSCFPALAYSLNPWSGTLTRTLLMSPCTWADTDPVGGPFYDSWLGYLLSNSAGPGSPKVQLSLNLGNYWELTIDSFSPGNGFIQWVGRKTSGATPVGAYTEIHGCSPATLTVS